MALRVGYEKLNARRAGSRRSRGKRASAARSPGTRRTATSGSAASTGRPGAPPAHLAREARPPRARRGRTRSACTDRRGACRPADATAAHRHDLRRRRLPAQPGRPAARRSARPPGVHLARPGLLRDPAGDRRDLRHLCRRRPARRRHDRRDRSGLCISARTEARRPGRRPRLCGDDRNRAQAPELRRAHLRRRAGDGARPCRPLARFAPTTAPRRRGVRGGSPRQGERTHRAADLDRAHDAWTQTHPGSARGSGGSSAPDRGLRAHLHTRPQRDLERRSHLPRQLEGDPGPERPPPARRVLCARPPPFSG